MWTVGITLSLYDIDPARHIFDVPLVLMGWLDWRRLGVRRLLSVLEFDWISFLAKS